MKWTAERMGEELKALLGDKLLSVVLYGSAAGGDHTGKNSDLNLLVLTHPLGLADLQKLSKAVIPWTKEGNPPPLFLTRERLGNFVDVFPIEISDIHGNHRILYGEDFVTKLSVSRDHLKVELEHELQGKLLQLKTRFILTEGKPGPVTRLMVESLSTFLVLFKNALWLYGKTPPVKKMDALLQLKEHLSCDVGIFREVEFLKRGESPKDSDIPGMLEKYLNAIETIADKISRA